MREMNKAEEAIVEQVDARLEEIEQELEPFKGLIDERNRLNKVKSVFLSEKGLVRGGASGQLSSELVEDAFKKADEKYLTVAEISKLTGYPDSTVRSHLNRLRNERYKKKGERWRLIGRETEDD